MLMWRYLLWDKINAIHFVILKLQTQAVHRISAIWDILSSASACLLPLALQNKY